MRGFVSFIRKETLHILRDRRTMLVVLLMPIIQMTLFGFAISTEVNNINFAVVVPVPSESIRQQVEQIAANPYFTFKGKIEPHQTDDILQRGSADVVIVFDEAYDRKMQDLAQGIDTHPAIQLIFDASNPNIAASGAGYLQNILQGNTSSLQIETHTM